MRALTLRRVLGVVMVTTKMKGPIKVDRMRRAGGSRRKRERRASGSTRKQKRRATDSKTTHWTLR